MTKSRPRSAASTDEGRFTRRAARDLAELADYIRARDPAAAERVRASILDSLRNLAAFPEIGRPQSVAGVRKIITRRYPYLVYYTVDSETDEVVVLTIQHPARKRPQTEP